jgi:4-alpha-glucanotransferase
LLGVSLADAVGDRRPQNLPGTVDEYPNWRVPLCDGDGRPVLVEDLARVPGVAELARTVSARGSGLPAA